MPKPPLPSPALPATPLDVIMYLARDRQSSLASMLLRLGEEATKAGARVQRAKDPFTAADDASFALSVDVLVRWSGEIAELMGRLRGLEAAAKLLQEK